jgi:hypothetical protein
MEIRKRTRDKIEEHHGIRSIYKSFRKDFPAIEISPREYTTIVLDGYREIINKIIYANLTFKIPGRLGFLRIRKMKIKIRLKKGKLDTNRLSIDWGSTRKLWDNDIEARENKRLIYHLNEHSEGYVHRFYWAKYFAIVRNKCVYAFVPCRDAKRLLAKGIKENNELDFYE